MRYKIKYILIMILIIIPINFFPVHVNATSVRPDLGRSLLLENEKTPNNIAVVIVIDTSGSMQETDPQVMRGTAANVFIDLLNSEDYLGIITFNSEVSLVQPITKLQDIDNKEVLKDKLNSNISSDGDTNYKAALVEASNQLDKLGEEVSSKAILFITDGEPDPDPARSKESGYMESYMKQLWKTVDNLTTSSYPVYSMGFSDGIRSDVLQEISSKTGGSLQILSDSKLLTSGSIRILEDLKNCDIITNEDSVLVYSSNSESDTVLPVINHDLFIKNEGYRVGENTNITSFLTIGGIRLKQDDNLTIHHYQLNITNTDGTKESIPLYDDGNKEHNDMIEQDGIWSNTILFSKVAVSDAVIKVDGIYNGAPFEVKKEIGAYEVFAPGNIIVTPSEEIDLNHLLTVKGKVLSIPVTLQNSGHFTEALNLSLGDDLGRLVTNHIVLEPNEIKDTIIQVVINKNAKTNKNHNSYNVSIGFKAENEQTTISTDQLKLKVKVITKAGKIFMVFSTIFNYVKDPFFSVFIFFLFVYVIGIILFKVVYRKKQVVNGILTYELKSNESTMNSKTFCITGLNKSKLVISFDENNPNADYYIKGTKYRYDMTIMPENNPIKLAFIAGWVALIQKSAPVDYILSTSMPGIIEKDGSIYTRIALKDNEKFESGGYIFWFSLPMGNPTKEMRIGKNILEGKYEKSTNQKHNPE